MKPIDFVLFDGDSSPNDPIYKIYEALQKDIVIRGGSNDFIILSYYFDEDENVMVLDIEPNT